MQHPAPNMYPHINFEPYRFVQFPEWVMPPNPKLDARGQPIAVLCHDEEEKSAVLGGSQMTPREADEKTSLYAIAEEKGIVVDKRWGVDTLRSKVLGN